MNPKSKFQPVIHQSDNSEQKSHPDVEKHDFVAHFGNFWISEMSQSK